MKHIYITHQKTDAGWQHLGDLNLSVSADVNFAINTWLTELLGPFKLSTDFLERVLEAVQASVARAIPTNHSPMSGNVHLSIFVPCARIPERKVWGFFHIERIENQAETVDARDHAIDFYLYVEGQ